MLLAALPLFRQAHQERLHPRLGETAHNQFREDVRCYTSHLSRQIVQGSDCDVACTFEQCRLESKLLR